MKMKHGIIVILISLVVLAGCGILAVGKNRNQFFNANANANITAAVFTNHEQLDHKVVEKMTKEKTEYLVYILNEIADYKETTDYKVYDSFRSDLYCTFYTKKGDKIPNISENGEVEGDGYAYVIYTYCGNKEWENYIAITKRDLALTGKEATLSHKVYTIADHSHIQKVRAAMLLEYIDGLEEQYKIVLDNLDLIKQTVQDIMCLPESEMGIPSSVYEEGYIGCLYEVNSSDTSNKGNITKELVLPICNDKNEIIMLVTMLVDNKKNLSITISTSYGDKLTEQMKQNGQVGITREDGFITIKQQSVDASNTMSIEKLQKNRYPLSKLIKN